MVISVRTTKRQEKNIASVFKVKVFLNPEKQIRNFFRQHKYYKETGLK
jgi:hypothetical protein